MRGIACFALVLLLIAPLAAQTEDVEATFEAVIDSFNHRKLDDFLSHWHPDAVFYTANYYFPLALGDFDDEDWVAVWKEFFDGAEELSLSPTDVNFRVTGSVAQAWGTVRLLVDPRQGQTRSATHRVSIVFVRDGGQWKILSWHDSRPRDPERPLDRPENGIR